MLPFWLIFIVPSLVALKMQPLVRLRTDGTRPIRFDSSWLLTLGVLTVVIGFRFDVGGDWTNYFRYLRASQNLSFSDILLLEDPGYWALNVLSVKLGFGITGVNSFSALLFSSGLVLFCRSLPRPWVALACSIPYLVVVVAMGYTRQSIALAMVMVGLVFLGRRRLVLFILFVLFGAVFHKSAVLMLPIAGLVVTRNRFISLLFVAVASIGGYYILLADAASGLLNNYTDQNIVSEGALIRLSMNVVPGVIFLLYRDKFSASVIEKKLWSLLSYISIGMFLLFFPANISTALDRLALYIIPLQLFVFSHLPDAVGRFGGRNQALVGAILLYYAVILFVWLNFAGHSHYWIPYHMGVS